MVFVQICYIYCYTCYYTDMQTQIKETKYHE